MTRVGIQMVFIISKTDRQPGAKHLSLYVYFCRLSCQAELNVTAYFEPVDIQAFVPLHEESSEAPTYA